MHFKHVGLYFLCFFSFGAAILALSNISLAQQKDFYPIGKIAELEGDVFILNGENRKKMNIDDPVYMGSKIETDTGGKALILFIDDTQIALAEKTRLTIDEYVFDPYDAEENEGEFSVESGAFQWLSGMLSKRERPKVKINTKYGSIGIRGTQFWAGEIEDGFGVFVDDGRVAFQGEWGAADLPAGESIYLEGKNLIERRKDFWDGQRRRAALQRIAFKKEGVEERLRELKNENVRARHDYRSRMWPYKENPFRGRIKPGDDGFYTDDFEDLRDGRK